MTTTIPATAATGTAIVPPAPPTTPAPIIVASDGATGSEPALLAARLLAARFHAPVQLVSVVTPRAFVVPAPDGLVLPTEPVAELVASRRDQLRDEMLRILGSATAWPTEVRVGVTALELADVAEASHAQVVVTGLSHQNRLDRMLRGDTPLGILRSANVPTLVVPPTDARLPRRVMIGVDLTPASVEAATRARPYLADAQVVDLVHVEVRPEVAPPMQTPAWDAAYREARQRAFSEVTAALQLPESVRLETHVLCGDVATELLDFADKARVDLLVVGHRRRPLIERLLSFGVTSRLYRGVATWMLMVPEREREQGALAASFLASGDAANEQLEDRANWAPFLEEFSERNVGRRSTLEIHNYQIGAQTTVCGYPLRGLDYDRHGGRVDIMLGEEGAVERHLTHTVRRVQRIQLYRLPDGRDGALRVSDRLGDCLLTLAR